MPSINFTERFFERKQGLLKRKPSQTKLKKTQKRQKIDKIRIKRIKISKFGQSIENTFLRIKNQSESKKHNKLERSRKDLENEYEKGSKTKGNTNQI